MSRVKLIEKREVAEGTMAFFFEKPKNFRYAPGQFAYYAIGEKGLFKKKITRHFSLVTVPSEERIGFATRMRSASDFKNMLKEYPLGSEVDVDGAYGEFVLERKETEPLIFLAGGIGITPFFSMLKEETKAPAGRKVTLFYANRNPRSAAFLEELQKMENENVRIVPIMSETELPAQEWPGERGRIDAALIKKYCPEYQNSRFYIAGPPEMVKAMKETLLGMDVPSKRIKMENFAGY